MTFSEIPLPTDETTENRPGTRAERVGGADRRSTPRDCEGESLNS